MGTFHVPGTSFQFIEWKHDGTSFRTAMEHDPHHGNHALPLDGNLRPKIQLMEEKERRGYVTSSAIYFIFVIILELSKSYV